MLPGTRVRAIKDIEMANPYAMIKIGDMGTTVEKKGALSHCPYVHWDTGETCFAEVDTEIERA